MWKISLILVFLPFLSAAQQTYRVTNNSEWENYYHLIKGRIAYELRKPNNIYEIYFVENGETKKLTDVETHPKLTVGSNYVAWQKYNDNKNEIWYFDGISNKKISPDTSVTSRYPITAGKHIVWVGFTNNFSAFNYYHFNGEKTEILQGKLAQLMYPENLSTISEEALVIKEELPTDVKRIKLYDFDNKTYSFITDKKDTLIDLLYLSGKTLFYSLIYPDNQGHHHYNIYKDGKITVLPDSITEVLYFDSTYLVWTSPVRSEISVWKDNKNYLLSRPSYDNIEIHPELADVRFFLSKVDLFLYFNGKKFIDIAVKNKRNGIPSVGSGWRHFYKTSVIWGANSSDILDSVELYYFCGEEDTSCKPVFHPKPVDKTLKKVYFNNNNHINIELFGTSDEKYIVSLFDLRGRLIYNETLYLIEGENYFSIPVNFLHQSIYLIRLDNITNPDKSFSKKLLITN